MSKHIRPFDMGPKSGEIRPGDFRPRMQPKDANESPKDSPAPESVRSSPDETEAGRPLFPPMRSPEKSSTPGSTSDSITSDQSSSPPPSIPNPPLPLSVEPVSDASVEKEPPTPDESGKPAS